MTSSLLAAVLLAASAQNADLGDEPWVRPHLALTFGFGGAHAILGPQAELILGHIGIAAGLGLVDFPYSEYTNDPESHVSPSFAVRWFIGDGEGIYLSAHAAFFSADVRGGTSVEHEARDRKVFGLTAGRRFQLGYHWFADLGAGVAVQHLHRYGRIDVVTGLRDIDETHVRPGFIWGLPTPDVDLAIGIQF
ncbi:MAG: hypothetical protein ACJ79H_02995 [Myxococcales bacterium]